MHPHLEVATFFQENAEEIAQLAREDPWICRFSASACDRKLRRSCASEGRVREDARARAQRSAWSLAGGARRTGSEASIHSFPTAGARPFAGPPVEIVEQSLAARNHCWNLPHSRRVGGPVQGQLSPASQGLSTGSDGICGAAVGSCDEHVCSGVHAALFVVRAVVVADQM